MSTLNFLCMTTCAELLRSALALSKKAAAVQMCSEGLQPGCDEH